MSDRANERSCRTALLGLPGPLGPRTRHLLPLFLIGLLCLTASDSARADESRPVRFETDVRPILKLHCWQCHGDETELKGGLDARLARSLVEGGESGPAIVPGTHAESLLYQRIRSGEMPPGKKKISEKEIDIVARWIDAGAPTARPEPEALAPNDTFSQEEREHW